MGGLKPRKTKKIELGSDLSQLADQSTIAEPVPTNLDLDDSYEDDEYEIYFKNVEALMDELQKEEDNNLFKINLLQDEEQNVKKANDITKANIQKQLNEIDVFARNMQQIERTKQLMLQRYNFYLSGGGSSAVENSARLHKKQKGKAQQALPPSDGQAGQSDPVAGMGQDGQLPEQ